MDKIELFHKGKETNWFENALPLNPRPWSNRDVVNNVVGKIFEEIVPIVKPKRAVNRNKEAVKIIILNLFIAYKLGMPVRYSRNRSRYSRNKRYGKLFFKYDRVIPIIDTLIKCGYIGQKLGYNMRDKDIGRESRIWALPKLINLFQSFEFELPGLIEKTQHNEIIQLKNHIVRKRGKKEIKIRTLINYKDTETTINRRKNLTEYNNFIKEQNITITLNQSTIINQWFTRDLMYNMAKGIICIDYIQVKHKVIINTSNIAVYQNIYQYNKRNSKFTKINNPTITNTLTDEEYPLVLQYSGDEAYYCFTDYINTILTPTLQIKDNKARNKMLKKKGELSDYGIIKLQFTINYKYLHRVFSRSSFELNGRFFGAGHIGLPKLIRKNCLKINDNITIEPDYSSLHIRMLYHREGIQYKDDPYLLLCDNEDDRDFYKILQLIAINAETEAKTIGAVRKKIRDKEYEDYFTDSGYSKKWDLTDKFIVSQLRRFENAHKPIAKYLNSGIGLTLQNMDSQITEAILVRLMEQNIPCLPVHDSYIVQHLHKDALINAMLEEYEKKMGFEPVIG